MEPKSDSHTEAIGAAASPDAPITWRGALPGLIFIALLDSAYLWGGPAVQSALQRYGWAWLALFLIGPVAYIVASRRPLRSLGYHRRNAWRWYAWGVGAGALWRLLDVVLAVGVWSSAGPAMTPAVNFLTWLLNALVIVPLLEETFFRGYLQAGLENGLGPLPAIVIQALLFAGHPYHLAQGPLKLPSIVLFGLIAGVLYWRTRSIASVYGAHGMANVLPALIQAIGGAL